MLISYRQRRKNRNRNQNKTTIIHHLIGINRVEAKNNVRQHTFMTETKPSTDQHKKEKNEIEKEREREIEPSLLGTDKDVIVQPRLVRRTCMLPLLSSKISAIEDDNFL